ncbi:MAG: GNAT family N-acetyltransferase [Candidatus Bathyarchaeota archaeon]|nr:GNAT family N-acetyltransferase [Candidatus Bathyarchaeota archaeon]
MVSAIIRKATADDIDAIAEIERECFPDPTAYSKPQLAYLILRANSACFVETDSKALRGFIIVLYRKGTIVGGIETIDVAPAFQRRGVGLRLLAAAEEDMKTRGMKFSQLEVSEGNKAAIELYKKAGYMVNERLVGYYRFEHCGTRDAVRMVKTLS